ncbi:hypothetical protein ACO0RG_003649 [Hanseniaspora osmophila]
MLQVEQFTLRHHTSSVKALAVYQKNSCVKKCSRLYTADEHGNICEWDLPKRKLIRSWSVCDSKALQICIIGIGILKSDLENVLLYVHSKDHCLRFYDVTVSQPQKQSMYLPKPQLLWEMPVNTLNFSNVVVIPCSTQKTKKGSFQVWCCNTEDTEGIDVYEINPITKNLKRIVKNKKFGENVKRGIVMCICATKDFEYISVGYENGSCVLVERDSVYTNSNQHIDVPFDKNSHFEQPILSMSCSKTSLYIGQAKSSSLYEYRLKTGVCETINIGKSAGSQHFARRELSVTGICADLYETHNLIGFTTWETNTYYLFNVEHKEIINTLEKSKSNVVPVSLDPTGNIETRGSNDLSEFEKSNNVSIESCLMMLGQKNNSTDSEKSNSQNDVLTTQRSRAIGANPLAMKRINYMLQKDWLFLGFADGSVTVSNL